MEIQEWDDIIISGNILSEKDNPRVEKLYAMVATTYPEDDPDHDYIKVWPHNPNDSQLPLNHNGKLWFSRSESEITIVSKNEE